MGNGEAKELKCTTCGHELRVGDVGVRGGAGWRGIKGRKKYRTSNSIINKIYLEKNNYMVEIKASVYDCKVFCKY